MKAKLIGIICLLVLGGILTLRMRVSDDPLTGIWTGTWGPTPIHRMHVTVELKWDGKTLTGAADSGEQVIAFKNSSFNPARALCIWKPMP